MASLAADSAVSLEGVPWAGVGAWPWFAWPALRWAGLAAGILLVASVGIRLYGHHSRSATVAVNSLHEPAAVSPPSSASRGPAEKEPQTEGIETKVETSNSRTAAQRSGVTHRGRIAAGSESRLAPKKESDLQRSAEFFAPQALQGRSPLSPTPQPPVEGRTATTVAVQAQSGTVDDKTTTAVVAQNQIAQNQPQLPLNTRDVTNLDVVKAKDAVPAEAPATGAPASAFANARAGSVLWALASGRITRSYDGGKTWEGVVLDAGTSAELDIRSLAAYGSDVWAGDAAGALYHSSDGGNNWVRVTASAAGATLTGYVTSIQFSDTKNGKITTSTAEIWITSDAGQTWHKQQ